MAEQIEIGGRCIDIWPQDQMLFSLGSPKLVKTHFADTAFYHPGLKAKILELSASVDTQPSAGKNVCGHKIHDPEAWDCPEATLVSARAEALFRQVTRSATSAVDNSWATLYHDGDFCLPHSHLRAEVSIVYLLDTGDENPAWQGNGRLGFADPRLEICCPAEPGRMTAPQFPQIEPGDMLMFPGEIIHLVCPYTGRRPRITLSWNINREALPDANAFHAAQRQRASTR